MIRKQCYLCPGNKRAQGDANPTYENTFVFVNDYSAVKEEQTEYTPPAVESKGFYLSLFLSLRLLYIHVLTTPFRSLHPPPPRRTRQRKMLRPHLCPIPQSHPRRPLAVSNPARHPDMDPNLRRASVAEQSSFRNHSSCRRKRIYDCGQTERSISVHADL